MSDLSDTGLCVVLGPSRWWRGAGGFAGFAGVMLAAGLCTSRGAADMDTACWWACARFNVDGDAIAGGGGVQKPGVLTRKAAQIAWNAASGVVVSADTAFALGSVVVNGATQHRLWRWIR